MKFNFSNWWVCTIYLFFSTSSNSHYLYESGSYNRAPLYYIIKKINSQIFICFLWLLVKTVQLLSVNFLTVFFSLISLHDSESEIYIYKCCFLENSYHHTAVFVEFLYLIIRKNQPHIVITYISNKFILQNGLNYITLHKSNLVSLGV